MKKTVKILIATLIMIVLSSMPVLASTLESGSSERVVLQAGEKAVVRLYDRRGNWIADGILEISNPRNGRIGIYMTTLCHVAVDEIEMEIAVDQKAENSDTWTQVDFLTYNFTPKGNEELTDATIDIQLGGHESNRVYSLTGWHTVYYGNGYEELKSQTGGLKITG